MALSTAFSPQAKMLTPAQQQLILEDYTRDPGDPSVAPTVNFNNSGMAITGPLFEGDAGRTNVAVGPLTKAQVSELATEAVPVKPGALSQAAPSRQSPVDIAELLKQYMPQDDSQARYLALAQGLLSPTKTGSFSEQLNNVAGAMQQHRMEQEKTRAHYIPLIMQQVAAQQAREEQNQYRLEAQQQAQQARAEAAMQVQAFQKILTQQGIVAQDARSAADRASRETIAANKLSASGGVNEPVEPVTPVLGVPVPTVLPWANQSNAKDANKVRAAEVARGMKEIETDADNAKKLLAAAQEAQRFMELNDNTNTGGILDKFSLTQAAQSLGSNYSEMQGITSRLVPSMREVGSGSTSDFDAKMFQRGTMGVDKPKEVNNTIAQAYINKAKLAQDYADFRATYLEQNGTLQGANKQWSEYINANPIFDKTYQEVPRLNESRAPWREYFAGRVSGGSAPAAAPSGPPTDLAAKAAAELARRKGVK